jgi:outer membrane protein TolC
MLQSAIDAKNAQLDRTAGDVNRSRVEVFLRRQERFDLMGRAGVASARLGRLLLLDPQVKLVPIGLEVVPITLVGDAVPLDELIAIAIDNRPDFASNREFLAAAWERVRKSQRTPFLPKVSVLDTGGNFGGGINSQMTDFKGRNVYQAQVIWELKNLGFGNRQDINAQRAIANQTEFQLTEVRARLMSEVVEASQLAAAKLESLRISQQAVDEAAELYRISREGTFNVIDAKNLFDALRPLQSIQTLNQARNNYLSAVIDFNRAQFRLYTALGCPAYLLNENQGPPPPIEQVVPPPPMPPPK